MRLLVFRSLWGMKGTWQGQIDRIAAAGYDGIEAVAPEASPKEFIRALRARNLEFIPLIFPLTDVEYERELERVLAYQPLKVLSRERHLGIVGTQAVAHGYGNSHDLLLRRGAFLTICFAAQTQYD